MDFTLDIVDRLSNGERGQLALGRIFACHGFPFKPKKHVPLALSNKFMGIETDFSLQLTEGVVIVGPTQSRIDKVARLCGRSRESCSPKVARRIAGLIQYSGQWSGGRSLLPVMCFQVCENGCDCIGDKIGIHISLWDLHPPQ